MNSFLTRSTSPARAILKGIGVTAALPFLDAMVPAEHRVRQDRRRRVGASSGWCAWRWCTATPAAPPSASRRTCSRRPQVGRDFDLEPDASSRSRPFANTSPSSATPTCTSRSVHPAGNRRRPLPVERGVPDPVAPEADARGTTSSPAPRSTSSTRSSSARTRRSRRCSCRSRTSTRRAAAPTATPASTPTRSAGRRRSSRCRWCAIRASCSTSCSASARPPTSASPTSRPTAASSTGFRPGAQLKRELGSRDRARLNDYFESIREIERRIQRVEARNASGEQRALPDAPIGVPDSFEEHVHLMMDLMAVAFQADIDPRVLVQARSRRLGPLVPGERRHHRLPQRLAPRRA